MRLISYSTVGSNHRKAGLDNQDCVLTAENDRRAILVLADGVSSCAAGGEGARLVCERLRERLLGETVELFDEDVKTLSQEILGCALETLRETAAASGRAIEDYSSTLSLALVDKTDGRALLFQLGDSLIFIERDGKIVARLGEVSDRAETVCTTTKNAQLAVTVRVLLSMDYDSITMLTDGAWRPIYRDRATFAAAISELQSQNSAALIRRLQSTNDPDDASLGAVYRT